jgi:ABC-2 type transport system permease protein
VASRAAIYGRLALTSVRSQYQYRASFWMQFVGTFVLTVLDFVAILVIFHHLPQLAGWTLGEIAFIYGASYVVFKLADAVMNSMDRIPLLIRMGTFDQVLTRPLGSLGQVITVELAPRQIGAALQGLAILVFSLSRVDVQWTPAKVAVFVSMQISAFVIFCALFVATNAIAFWITDAREIANAFTYGGNYLTQFPLHVFGLWFRRILGYAFVLAWIDYFPSLYILDKPDALGAPPVFRFLSPLAAALIAGVAALVWRAAVRHYRSTGS